MWFRGKARKGHGVHSCPGSARHALGRVHRRRGRAVDISPPPPRGINYQHRERRSDKCECSPDIVPRAATLSRPIPHPPCEPLVARLVLGRVANRCGIGVARSVKLRAETIGTTKGPLRAGRDQIGSPPSRRFRPSTGPRPCARTVTGRSPCVQSHAAFIVSEISTSPVLMQDPGRNEGCRARSLSAPSSVEPALIEQTRHDEFRCRLRDARERLARSGARMKEELDSSPMNTLPSPR